MKYSNYTLAQAKAQLRNFRLRIRGTMQPEMTLEDFIDYDELTEQIDRAELIQTRVYQEGLQLANR